MKTPPLGGVLSFWVRSHLRAEFAESRVFVEHGEVAFLGEVFFAGDHEVAQNADQDEQIREKQIWAVTIATLLMDTLIRKPIESGSRSLWRIEKPLSSFQRRSGLLPGSLI